MLIKYNFIQARWMKSSILFEITFSLDYVWHIVKILSFELCT